ncbi:MAG: hypothetical protein ACREFQ_08380 [Stellaceae bacterium]
MARRAFLAALGSLLAAVGCGRWRYRSPEVVLFSTIGYLIFRDYVRVVDPGSGRIFPYLTPYGHRSYLGASARSLRGPAAVVVHDKFDGEHLGDAIELYWPPRRWRMVWYRPPGSPGAVNISPDGSRVAAVFRPKPKDYQHIWVLSTGGEPDPLDITLLWPPEGRTGDFSPHWRPDSRALLFRRLSVPPGGGYMPITIVQFDLATRQFTVLRPPSIYNFDACYGPGGSLIVREYGAIRQIATDGTVTELLPEGAIPGFGFLDSGLCYSAALNAVAFTVAETKLIGKPEQEKAIWLLWLADRRLQKLIGVQAFRIGDICFARP